MVIFDSIIPTIDKVEYTIEPKLYESTTHNSYEILISYLDCIFEIGKKKRINNKFGIYYRDNRIWISKGHLNWYRLQFFPKDTDINRLMNILSQFRTHEDKIRWSSKGNCYILCKNAKLQNINRAEIAFDLALPDYNQDFVENLTKKIAKIIYPKYGKSIYCKSYSSNQNYICKDGAINGRNSFYWRNNRKKNNTLKPQKSPNSIEYVVYPKLYCKDDDKDSIEQIERKDGDNIMTWHIRFEVRLNNYRINKIIENTQYTLPYDLDLILDEFLMDSFSTYFGFVEVDYKKFKRDALNYPDIDKIKFMKLYKAGIDAPAAHQLYLIRAISKN